MQDFQDRNPWMQRRDELTTETFYDCIDSAELFDAELPRSDNSAYPRDHERDHLTRTSFASPGHIQGFHPRIIQRNSFHLDGMAGVSQIETKIQDLRETELIRGYSPGPSGANLGAHIFDSNDYYDTIGRNASQSSLWGGDSDEGQIAVARSLPASRPQYEGHAVGSPSCLSPSIEFQTRSVRGKDHQNEHSARLRPVSELPDMFRGIFKFGLFNAIQSICFDSVMKSQENLVISAPTGSGKTVLFELAIIRMLSSSRDYGVDLKCVYMSPTKALCSERYRDWAAKFDPLGIKCCELTGDTVAFGKTAWSDAKHACIIITTIEKWDSLSRNWNDHGHVLSQVQLLLVDEVQILKESRGSTLEVVISRMKRRGAAVRFVLVSATIPNIQDIANWIGNWGSSGPARVFEFGEEYRPCKLTRFVYGVPRAKGQNDFSFSRSLDFRLFGTLQTHSVGKPILVFCSTRKGVLDTGIQLMKDYIDAEERKQPLPWSRPGRISQTFIDSKLFDLAVAGIGIHHAGLTMEDRRTTEDLYCKKLLRLVVCTSTLAVGVNLPAHTVVIKGVHTFQNNASVEYSDLDVMQMLGRAGRPQFDKEGVTIIMCEKELEDKYRALVHGTSILESSLHKNLSEHLNSEIGLGTITDLETAKNWLKDSFLFQRIQNNPGHYALGKDDGQTWDGRIDDIVMQTISTLQDTGLVTYTPGTPDGSSLSSTDYGDIMSKFYIRQATMGLILNLSEKANMREMLEMIAAADEFSDIKLRSSEKLPMNKLRRHEDIRFEVKKVEKAQHKILLLIQAVLGGISLSSSEFKSADSQPNLDAVAIFRHISRIARAVVEVAIVKKLGAQVKSGLELLRCLSAKAWEDRPVVLRQIEQIGEKSLKVLAEHGITSFHTLKRQDPLKIEMLLNRRPPFGTEILASVKAFPLYYLDIKETHVLTSGGNDPVEVDLVIECGLVQNHTDSRKSKKSKGHEICMTAILTLNSDMDFLDFRRIPTLSLRDAKTFEVTALLTKPSHSIIVYMSAESIAGVSVTGTYKPVLSPREFPTMNTRPLNAVEQELASLENDPTFWQKMELSDDEEVTIKDLTKPKENSIIQNSSRSSTFGSLTTAANTSLKTRILSNGRYSCNHLCKDKTKCRHLCCREGMEDPPHFKKRKVTLPPSQGTRLDKPSSENPEGVQVPTKRTIDNKVATKQDRTLQDLEALHKHSQVANHIGLNSGHRIKVDPAAHTKFRKSKPNFDLSFADIGEDITSTSNFEIDVVDDEDDLPEAGDILMLTGLGFPSKPSANSQPPGSDPSIYSGQPNVMSPMAGRRTDAGQTSWDPTKASQDDDDLTHRHFQSRKRPRRDEPTESPRKGPSGRKELFFLSVSDSEQSIHSDDSRSFQEAVQDSEIAEPTKDQLCLDCSFIDILPSMPSQSGKADDFETTVLNEEIDYLTMPKNGDVRSNGTCNDPATDGKAEADEFAQLDAWLNSEMVVLMP